MTRFYSFSDNSSHNRGMPVIYKIAEGMIDPGPCPRCGIDGREPSGDLKVVLPKQRGKAWPDAMACGGYPLLVVSERFVKAMQECGIRLELGGKITFTGPCPRGLSLDEAPQYFWVDGRRHFAGRMDFEASGYVDVRFCEECGYRSDNVAETHRRREGPPPLPYVFEYDASRGHDLFTTDLSPTAFFATDRVLECARKHRLINLRFTPVEAGDASWSKGIDYLGKRWPPYHPLRRSEGRTLEEWVALLRKPKKRYEAKCAILDLGPEAAPAVPTLISMLEDEDLGLRRTAARLLKGLGKMGVPLGPKGQAAAREFEEWFQQTLGRPATPAEEEHNS